MTAQIWQAMERIVDLLAAHQSRIEQLKRSVGILEAQMDVLNAAVSDSLADLNDRLAPVEEVRHG